MAVLGPHRPDKLADLMGYQSLIARASKKFMWPSWLVYDQNFRQEAAGNTSLQWAKAEPSLHAQCFTGQEISKENWCSRCHGVDHQSADCPYGSRKRTWSGGPSAASVSQPKAAATGGHDQQLCIKFNKYGGDCKFGKDCKFLHACTSCKGPHPVSKCRAGSKAARRRWAGWTKLNSTRSKDPQLFDSHILYCLCCYSYSMLLNANCAGSDNGLWLGIG